MNCSAEEITTVESNRYDDPINHFTFLVPGLATDSIILLSVVCKKAINEPSLGRILFSFVPPRNSLTSVEGS